MATRFVETLALILGIGFLTLGCSEASRTDSARQAWLTTKQGCGTYHYSIAHSSFTGEGAKTTVEITGDTPTARSFELFRYQPVPGSASPEKVTEIQWSETGVEVGTHDGVDPARTMEGLYDDCDHNVLSQDPAKNDITFKADARGILQQCWYYPHNCADDCDSGVVVAEFACGALPAP